MKSDVNVRCVLSKDMLLKNNSEQAVFALLEIKADSKPTTGSPSANIALVLDRSGSMDGEKLLRLKEAVGHVVDNLRDTDLVSITIFDDQVETVVPSQPALNREGIKAKLAGVIARGGTQISDGLRAGLGELQKGFAADRVNRIVLLTDGKTWDDEAVCLGLADEAAGQGISITSIGIGDAWNEKLLLQIAERSRGNSRWIEEPAAILDVFQDEVEGMKAVAANNLVVTARFSPGVRPVKVYATVPMIADISPRSIQGSSVEATLGTLDSRKGQVLLIEVRVASQKSGRFRLGQVEVSCDIPSQGITAQKTRSELYATFTIDAAAANRVNAEVMNLVEKLSAFKLQTRALSEAEAGNLIAATQKLQSAATVLLNLGEDELANVIDREITQLGKTGTFSAAGTKRLEYGTRRLTETIRQVQKV